MAIILTYFNVKHLNSKLFGFVHALNKFPVANERVDNVMFFVVYLESPIKKQSVCLRFIYHLNFYVCSKNEKKIVDILK